MLLFSQDTRKYSVATAKCNSNDAYLSTTKTEAELNFLTTIIEGDGKIWIGMDDLQTEGRYLYNRLRSVCLCVCVCLRMCL